VGIVAAASVSGMDNIGYMAVSYNVQLTDTRNECEGIGLDVVVTSPRGTTVGCWRVVGNMVYLSRMHNAYLGDATVPTDNFRRVGGRPLPWEPPPPPEPVSQTLKRIAAQPLPAFVPGPLDARPVTTPLQPQTYGDAKLTEAEICAIRRCDR